MRRKVATDMRKDVERIFALLRPVRKVASFD